MSDLGEASLCRLRGEGVRLRLLLTSPFLAPGPAVGLLGPSSSEEEDPVSVNQTDREHQPLFYCSLSCMRWGKHTKVGVRAQLQKSMRRWEQHDMDRVLVREREELGMGEDRTGIKTLITWGRLPILPAILTSLLHRICCCPFLIFILLWNVEHWVSHQC